MYMYIAHVASSHQTVSSCLLMMINFKSCLLLKKLFLDTMNAGKIIIVLFNAINSCRRQQLPSSKQTGYYIYSFTLTKDWSKLRPIYWSRVNSLL